MGLAAIVILATIFYALFDIFASRAGNRIDSNLSSTIFNGLGALVPLLIYFYFKSKNQITTTTSSSGIWYSLLAGVAIAIFSILLIKAFEKGGLSYAVPVIYGGAITISALVGWLIFKDSFSGLGAAGVLLILGGITLVVISKL